MMAATTGEPMLSQQPSVVSPRGKAIRTRFSRISFTPFL
jgi:hypothetical protein